MLRRFAFVLAASLIAATAAASNLSTSGPTDSGLSAPIVNEPVISRLIVAPGAVQSTFYECKPEHYDPPCRRISTGLDASGSPVLSTSAVLTNYMQLRAAVETAVLLTPIQVGEGPSAPTEACANTHGASGCCRIVHTSEGPDGTTVYIECGPR